MEMLRYLALRESRGEGPPNIREVGDAVGLRSSRSVHRHLERLRDGGFVEWVPGRHRSLALTGRGREVAGWVPSLGRVAAGRGLEAVRLEEEGYSMPQGLLVSSSGVERFLLKVTGDSMTEARIEAGDVLVVEPNESPEDGTVVVAMLGGGEEVTVKVLYREGDMVRLRPRNLEYEDIVLSAEDVEVQGEVIWVFHRPEK